MRVLYSCITLLAHYNTPRMAIHCTLYCTYTCTYQVITLNSVSIIVAEYIPFGANQIVQLNNSVGSTERCQGGFISPAIDDDSTGTDLEMSPELTSVDILDYTLTNHINFEAEINFAEDSGVVQVCTVYSVL
jgi:hypothetical protein